MKSGTIIRKRYKILEPIGGGKFAAVYKAEDLRWNRICALKTLHKPMTGQESAELIQRFHNEITTIAKLSHPHILPIQDSGIYRGMPYLVMPFMPGGTLRDKIGEPLSSRNAINLLLPVVHALRYAHQMGYIHRDIKPTNILFTADGDPMLADFGIAKDILSQETAITEQGTFIGTRDYAAPEQFFGKAVFQSDIYSLGIILFELLTGKFHNSINATDNTSLGFSLKSFIPNTPDLVEALVTKATSKEISDRYQDMDSLIDALEKTIREVNSYLREELIKIKEIKEEIDAAYENKNWIIFSNLIQQLSWVTECDEKWGTEYKRIQAELETAHRELENRKKWMSKLEAQIIASYDNGNYKEAEKLQRSLKKFLKHFPYTSVWFSLQTLLKSISEV